MQNSEFVALVTGDAENDIVEVEMRNKFSVGDTLEILSPDKKIFNKKIKVEKIISSEGENIDSAKKVQERVKINSPYSLKKGDILRR